MSQRSHTNENILSGAGSSQSSFYHVEETKDELERQVRAYDVALAAIDAEIAAVEKGTHPEYLRRCKRLQAAKDERELRAKKAYDQNIQTVQRLHDLELVCSPFSVSTLLVGGSEETAGARRRVGA